MTRTASAAPASPAVTLPSGRSVPALGQGTWHMGDRPERREREIATLREGLDLGLTLIDTAEMYGQGTSERLVGEALSGRRESAFVVTKVLPSHATRLGVAAACEASLRRLGTDHVDLYLLHWRGSVPLEETVDGFHDLLDRGLIGGWGVSNFEESDLDDLPAGEVPEADQVLYNLSRRWPEPSLLPALRDRGIALMAYSPIEQGRILGSRALRQVADRHEATPARVAMAWVLTHPGVVAIPQASSPEHVRDNAAARALATVLDSDDLALLEREFPEPTASDPRLEML